MQLNNLNIPLDDIKTKLKLSQAKRWQTKDSNVDFASKLKATVREVKKTAQPEVTGMNAGVGKNGRFQSSKIGPNLAGSKVTSSQVFEPVNITEDIKKSPQHKKLWETSQELESMFLKLMLNEQRKNIGKTKLIDGGRAEEIFEDMLYDEYSLQLAQNQRFGLAENLYEELSRRL